MLFLKHDMFKDVCIQCVEERKFDRNGVDYLKIVGWFWNLGVNESHNIGQHCSIEIKYEDRVMWKRLLTDDTKFLRTANWI